MFLFGAEQIINYNQTCQLGQNVGHSIETRNPISEGKQNGNITISDYYV
jgi:hypothetical protein